MEFPCLIIRDKDDVFAILFTDQHECIEEIIDKFDEEIYRDIRLQKGVCEVDPINHIYTLIEKSE